MYNRRPHKRGKKREFSKCWLVSCAVMSLVFTTTSYVLAAFDKNPVSELSQSIIETMWGTSGVSFVGYAIQNCIRAYTSAKFGIPAEKPLQECLSKEDIDADL